MKISEMSKKCVDIGSTANFKNKNYKIIKCLRKKKEYQPKNLVN